MRLNLSLAALFWEITIEKIFFAVPVELSYKGKSAFTTRFGGCVSILLIVAISVGATL